MGVVQRTSPIGTTTLLKEGKSFDPVTGTYNDVPYLEKKSLMGTTTTV